jgi:O-6-methylguanine DNA methyltransferase
MKGESEMKPVSRIVYQSHQVGWLEILVSDAGVRALGFVEPDETAEFSLAPETEKWAELVTRELDAYFAAGDVRFTVPLDERSGTPFRRRVWKALREIPPGQVRTYAQIAAAVGAPGAARAVGSANGANPIAILTPCHRVVRADGGLGGYSSGVEIKRRLLAIEGVHFA